MGYMLTVWNKRTVNGGIIMEEMTAHCDCCRKKDSPRSEEMRRLLQNRISRMTGQLGGISAMIDDNRYCGDILIQLSAVMSALRSFGYIVLQDHMETCVADKIRENDESIIDETVELIKKLR